MNKKAVLIASAVIVFLAILSRWPVPQVAQAPSQEPSSSNEHPSALVSVEIQKPDETLRKDLTCRIINPCPKGAQCFVAEMCDLNAFSALQKMTQDDTIAMQSKTYEGLGVLVTDLAGLSNGQDGKYWVYEVNGNKIPQAADQYVLHPDDHLVWKFVIPDSL